MGEKEIIEINLRRYFEQHEKRKAAILPLRNLSGLVSDVLKEEFGVQEQFIVDNYAFDLKHIYPMDQMPHDYRECVFFLAAFGNTKKILREQLLNYVSEEQIVDLMYDEERDKVFNSNVKVHLDFLCPGFAKCGTTSLHYALAQNSAVYLPPVKETYFLRYSVNEASHEAFKAQYKEENTAGKLVGGIEPDYRSQPADVYRYFGGGLKLIFCVRNPINVLYSDFKMEMRNAVYMMDSAFSATEIMGGFEHVTPEMFDWWATKYRHRGLYSNFIKSFQDYYPKEQIKIMVSEELFANAYQHMESLQSFLGIPQEYRLAYREFPRENTGSKVSKDQRSLEINLRIGQLRRRLMRQGDAKSLNMLQTISDKIEPLTMVDYSEPMLERTRRDLQDYYMDSIRELEDMLGRSLQGVWY